MHFLKKSKTIHITNVVYDMGLKREYTKDWKLRGSNRAVTSSLKEIREMLWNISQIREMSFRASQIRRALLNERSFPGGSVIKNLPANTGTTGDGRSISG